MALFAQMQLVQLLLADVDMKKVNEADVTTFVNIGRKQVAGEGECIRQYANLAVDNTNQQYNLSAITGLATGVSSVLKINTISYQIGQGTIQIHPRAWPYFARYFLGQVVPVAGPPTAFTIYGQGATGSLFVNLLDQPYTLNCDCVCLPIDLVDDTTVDLIPPLWTDAVPFFAAYYAVQTLSNQDMAAQFLQQYKFYMDRARQFATPGVLPQSYSQAPDPFIQNRLGIKG